MTYPETLYRFDTVADTVPGLDAVGDAEVGRYHDDGFLAVAPALTAEQVRQALDGLRAVLLDPRGADVEFEAWAEDRLDALDPFDVVRKCLRFVDVDDRLLRITR